MWNGNISAAEWNAPAKGAEWHAYKYAYDKLGRLKKAEYARSATPGAGYGADAGFYNTSYEYDLSGNITELNRKHENTPIDALTFSYPEGNRLAQITDDAANSLGFDGPATYAYDVAGRMTNDSKKGTVAYNHLSLPISVGKGSDTLRYTYDAAGRRLKRQFKTETARYYVNGAEYEDNLLKFVATPYGRIRKEGGNWAFDYFLKDHLGNVRVVLGSDALISNQAIYTASMEDGNAQTENLYFNNIENTRADRPYNYPDKNPLNTKLAKVPGKSRGPSITLQVMAGDTIEISAKAFYNIDKTLPGKGVDIAPVLGTAIAAMTNPVSGALDEAAQLAVDLGATASNSAALVQVPKEDQQEKNVQPESGLKFVLYDSENFKPVEENSGVRLVEDKINVIQNLHTDKMVMQQAGFLEVFLDNQAQTPVFFDNFVVTQSTGPVKEVNAYYPYGMIIGGLSFQAAGDEYNAYKYNGKELQDLENFKTGWLDYGARMLDGPRWMVPDPMAEKYYGISPYVYCANNPMRFIDPDGLTHYSLDSLGNVAPIIATYDEGGHPLTYVGQDDKYDMLIAGKKSLQVNDKSILTGLSTYRNNYNGSYAVTGNQSEVFDVFVFAANNSDAEWGLSGFSTESSDSYVISTSHDKEAVSPATTIDGFDEFDMTFKIHSHPSGATTQASAPPQGMNDMSNLNDMSWRFYNKYGATYSVPPHYIYHPNSKSVLQYSIHPYSRGTSRGTSTTGVGIRRTLGLIN